MITLLGWIACCTASEIVVVRPPVDAATEARRARYVEGQPGLRGFRAPILDAAGGAWPIDPPDAATEPRLAEAAVMVARRLAPDGLVPTLVRVVDLLDVFEFKLLDEAERLRTLQRVGLPIDWLPHFRALAMDSLLDWVVLVLSAGMPVDFALQRASEEITFAFQPTVPGFEVATESGEHDIESLRFQVSGPARFLGEGDGGTIDLARQLVTGIEGVDHVAAIQDENLESFLAIARSWTIASGSTFTIVPQALPVTGWAQDNGKAGFVADSTDAAITLVPRYASRGEVGAAFLPGDTFALEGFAATGRRVVQSPLLFQGGDLIPVLDPRTNRRQMLVGEAEIARNRTLGLSQAQVLEAFRAEFGVERCIVMPATSFHVDYELTVRATPQGLVAFVNDTSAAARLVMTCALPALERAGVLSAQGLDMTRADAAAGRWNVVVERISEALSGHAVAHGAFPESFARHFSGGPADSGIGSLQRMLLALDSLVAEMTGEREIAQLDLDRHLAAYLLSIRRREVERQSAAQVLAREGFRIVGVPSTSEGKRSLTTINGVHARGVYYMPAYGGLYAELDRAAQRVFEQNLGEGVRVVPILCGESMRREGALHCAVSIVPGR